MALPLRQFILEEKYDERERGASGGAIPRFLQASGRNRAGSTNISTASR